MKRKPPLSGSLLTSITELTAAFQDKGELFDIGVDEDKYVRIFESLSISSSEKNVTAVINWCWWDVAFTEEEVKVAGYDGYSVIKANYIVRTNHPNFRPGDWVKTSALVKFHSDQSIFETKNTLYILVGRGTRKTLSAKDAFLMF